MFKVDVLACPCGSRRRILAFLTDAAQCSKILRHLGLDDRVPPLAPPRDLDAQLGFPRRASAHAPDAPTHTELALSPASLDERTPSPSALDHPFLPDPDPPAGADEGSFDACRDPLPSDDFADPPAPEPS